MTATDHQSLTDEQLAEIEQRIKALLPDPWFLSDCEGDLQIWQEHVLRNVSRDEHGNITGYRLPADYWPSDLIAEWSLNTWDPGEDKDDDRRRIIARFIAAARQDVPALLAEVRRLQAELADERRRCVHGVSYNAECTDCDELENDSEVPQ